eukprot:m.44984 g.44984  ORF g.44984 m.44984 type:complete len:470 (-) comp10646_c0_seq1:1178-2587(-)
MSDLIALTERLEKVALRLEQVATSGVTATTTTPTSSSSSSGDDNASIAGFDEVLNGPFAEFLSLSKAIGGDVATQVGFVEAAFNAQRAFIVNSTKAKKPSNDVLPKLLGPTSTPLGETQSFRESNRRSEQFNHLSAVSEGIPCLGWVGVSPKPCPFIKEMRDAAQFYTNRVLKDFKGKNETHVNWAKAWVAVFDALHDYVKRVHTTGLVWNANGVDASTLSVDAPAPPKAEAPKPAAPKVAPTKGNNDTRDSLFAALSKGSNVTSGLKKVDKSQMTHKNPNLRASSVVSATNTSPPKRTFQASRFGGTPKTHDPVFELDGKKWKVEYQKENNDMSIEGNMKQTVYIYKCERSTVRITGKVNSIIIDSCKKVGVVFETAIAAMEVINSQSAQVQVLDKVPTISIDKTDGCQVYLSSSSLETEIVTAKSSEMNVLIPEGEEGDFKEMPVPEQFKTKVKNGALVTEMSDINS